ncbi:hypothetical protein NKI74_33885 [Mesorhizobium sp. M0494]|uniref:hypothetical protein n=1 Tax=Mesorhizobium sp. M0494 TaxID=2956951 RepID=UPI00333B368D
MDHSFASTEVRERRVRDHFEGRRRWTIWKQERRDERKRPHGFEVGHVLYASLGYDQTNIDFYQVTKIIGAHMVEVYAVSQISGHMKRLFRVGSLAASAAARGRTSPCRGCDKPDNSGSTQAYVRRAATSRWCKSRDPQSAVAAQGKRDLLGRPDKPRVASGRGRSRPAEIPSAPVARPLRSSRRIAETLFEICQPGFHSFAGDRNKSTPRRASEF